MAVVSLHIAHQLGGVTERTEDVVTGESRIKTFPDLLLFQPVLRGLHTAGFVQPSPVQLLAIPQLRGALTRLCSPSQELARPVSMWWQHGRFSSQTCRYWSPLPVDCYTGVTVVMQVGAEIQCNPCTFLSSQGWSWAR